MMSLELVTPPAVEPVTLDEAKAHLKVDTSADDGLIARLIAAARARAEWHAGRAFITQGWIQWLDRWPESGIAELALPPLRSVVSVTAYARDDTASVWDPSIYKVDAVSAPGRVALACTAPPLIANLRRVNAVAIAFSAGYGDAAEDVPALLREAILEIVAGLYAHRGDGPEELPLAAEALLAPYRVFNL
jgi:uncharacterized phiE125 gp8 family phage protein